MKKERTYICIDLKSFYASVECVERKLDPLTANLVVADVSRTEKTICLAVSPSLKAYGLSGRSRLFEVVQRVKEINRDRKYKAKIADFEGSSCDSVELKDNPKLALDYIAAPPRMALYMKYSTDIYNIYLKYIAPEDIHVYSVDEVFIDVTDYLTINKTTPHDFAYKIIKDILKTTGITATAGIGTNMYLAKIALDIMAKRIEPDRYGVRIAELDEMSYRRELWGHRPITDFWRVGKGTAERLEKICLYTMGDIARYSLSEYGEDKLYRLFGVYAELLIDHAWGWEPCTIADIRNYKPENKSISSGQVLHCPYDFDKARLVAREMADIMALGLVDKRLVTDQIVLTIGYDIENLTDKKRRSGYNGEIKTDRYGRKVPKHAHGTENLGLQTASTRLITEAVMSLYDRIVDKNLLIRRMNITANHIVNENDIKKPRPFEQLDLFTDYEKLQRKREEQELERRKEKNIQRALIDIKKHYGKNAVIKGMNLEEGATAMDRNRQIGGHKA